MALEDTIDELALEPDVGHLLDLDAAGAGHPLAEGAGPPVLPLHRRIERHLGRGHPMSRADVLDRIVERDGDFGVGRLPAQLLGQKALGPGHPDQGRVLVQRDSHAAGLLGQRLQHRLADPPDGIRDELDPVVGIELLDRLEQPLVADRDELGEIESVTLILLHVGDHESEVGRDQPFGGSFIAGQRTAGQPLLLVRIGDHGQLLNIQEVLIERAGGSGASKRASFPGSDMGHRQPRQS